LWVADSFKANAFICVQNPYSLLNRRLETEMFGLVRDQGLGAMAYSPLAVGLLSGAYRPDQPAPAGTLWATRRKDRFEKTMQGVVAEVVSTLQQIAADLGKTAAQTAIAWVLSHPEVTCAISGADNIAQLDDVLGAVGWELPPDMRRQLDEASAALNMILD
jgi:aryl-alcohol dehydrogenase-like predicted oxidoreductase